MHDSLEFAHESSFKEKYSCYILHKNIKCLYPLLFEEENLSENRTWTKIK